MGTIRSAFIPGILVMFLWPLSVFAQLPPADFYQLRKDDALAAFGFHCLAEDPYGFLWFGSYHGGGLFRYDGYAVRKFSAGNGPDQGLPSNYINTVYHFDGDQIWIGTRNGFARLDLVTGQSSRYLDALPRTSDQPTAWVEPILEDGQNQCYWLGTQDGIWRMNRQSDSLRRMPWQGPDTMPGGIIAMVSDVRRPDHLWFGTTDGLFQYNVITHALRKQPLPHSRLIILDIYQAPSGILWVAGGDGQPGHPPLLASFDPSAGEWKLFPLRASHTEDLPAVNVAYKIEPAASDEYLWVSTHYNVGLFHKPTGQYEAWQYRPDNPAGLLPNGFFRSMLTDRHGRLWVTGWEGIHGSRGPLNPPPDKSRDIRVRVIDVSTSNPRAGVESPLLYEDTIRLYNDQRDITLRYVLPNPAQPDKVKYQYRLEGKDPDWRTTDQRSVQYNGLSGGTYAFHIRASDDGVDWTPESRLVIEIPRRTTEYPWFWMLSGLIGVSLLLGTHRILLYRARRTAARQADFDRRLAETELQVLRGQMNPHFLFNSLNAIKYYALHKDKDATADYISRFAQLMRTILGHSKRHTIGLQEELEALRLYVEIEHLRLDGKFDYTFDIEPGVRADQVRVPPMILQPYVENAIWHGLMPMDGGGRLRIRVESAGDKIRCIIEDNGIGREAARRRVENSRQPRRSMGMEITRDRIDLVNKTYGIDTSVTVVDLYDPAGRAAGTRVVIDMPVLPDDIL